MLCLCLFLSTSVSAERKALLIGNSAYKIGGLRNPSNDVDKMRLMLAKIGFRGIIAKTNLTKAQMKQVIRQFTQSLKAGDEALFYYSGHGVQAGQLNYLIPVGNDIQAEDEVADEAIPLRFVLNKLGNTRAKLNLVILDACRDNPFKTRFKGIKKGLTRMTHPVAQSTLVAFSASFNQTSDDGNRGNGLYTQYLLQHLATPNITLSTMFNKVRHNVYKASNGKQHPKEENGLLQDVYLNKVSTAVDHNAIERQRQHSLRQQQLKAQQAKIIPQAEGTPSEESNMEHSQQWYIDQWNINQENNLR